MAITPTIQTSQSGVMAPAEGGKTQTSQVGVMTVANFPTDETKSSQLGVQVVGAGASEVQVAQAGVMVVAKGRIDDPKVRVWTYTMDGHDYYIVRLGTGETLVYDTHSKMWFTWGSRDTNLWRALDGINWQGGTRHSHEYGSNVIVGDDGNGSLYFLNPDQYKDDTFNDNGTENFQRVIHGQMFTRGYDFVSVFAVELLGSIGKMDESDLTTVEMQYTDDKGVSYVSAGSVTIPNEEYGARVKWQSLGSVNAPGRMFKIIDEGALVRIDNLTVEDSREES